MVSSLGQHDQIPSVPRLAFENAVENVTLPTSPGELSSTCVETPFRGDVIRPLAPPLGVGLG
jgi:hypothetical protein